uniref:Insulin receptor substrate 1 n=1 Tax=Leptobrachium leishanense TaxID=445787 RepID=A0A8C5QP48_9ANUR
MDEVKKSGYLRKQKSMRRRYFVLRGAGSRGPARLEYYDNEKKFRVADGSGAPRGSLSLEEAFGVNKRADAKRKYLLVLYTRDGGLTLSADSEEEQEEWYRAIMELQAQARAVPSSSESPVWPGPPFREVWQVSLRPRGLGQTRNLSGIYRLCLTERTLSLVRLRSDAPSVTLQLMNVRRCGHSDNYFFVEVGRSAVTGPGELWMQVEDSVVAQNMHETILEAMKSLSEEFRPRTKSQSLSSTPITVPSRRHHANPPPPSQVGGLSQRSKTESNLDSSPVAKSHSSPRNQSPMEEEEEKRPQVEVSRPSVECGSASSDEYGSSPSQFEPQAFLPPSPGSGGTNYILMAQNGRRSVVMVDTPSSTLGTAEEEAAARVAPCKEDNYAMMDKCESREAGYMPMLPVARSQDYMPMTPNSVSPPAPVEMTGYVMMSPLGSGSPETERISWPPSSDILVGSADSHSSDYMNMWPLSRSASATPPPQDPSLSPFEKPSRVPTSYRSLPRSYKMDPTSAAHSGSSSDSLEEAIGGRIRRPLSVSVDSWRTDTLCGNFRRPPSPGEYVRIHYSANHENANLRVAAVSQNEYIAMDSQHSLAANGDYTEMVFEPIPKPVTRPAAEQPVRRPVESMFVSMLTPETKTRANTEKVLVPNAALDNSSKSPTDKTFWPSLPRETCPNAKLSSELCLENTLGFMEKALASNSAAEDGEVRPLVSPVVACGLHKGPERTKADLPARVRHCSDTPSNVPAASCNGNRSSAQESDLNYIDLDLAKDGGALPGSVLVGSSGAQLIKSGPMGAVPCSNTYASIDFQMSGELKRDSGDGTEC